MKKGTTTKIKSICKLCKKEFLYYQSCSNGNFCSKICYINYKARKTNTKEFKCNCCGKLFIEKIRNSDSDRKYCSIECYRKMRNSGYYKKKSLCIQCNSEYYPYRKNSKFCSNIYFHNWSIGRFVAWNKGLKGTHFSVNTEFKKGENHIFWKGGISKEPYPFNFNDILKLYIRGMYHFRCQLCNNESDLVVHHIDYNKNNLKLNNLIPLCRSCHSKTNYNRKHWKTILKKIVIFDDTCPSNINIVKGK